MAHKPMFYGEQEIENLLAEYVKRFHEHRRAGLDCFGWDLFHNDEHGYEIERDDDAEVFARDDDALLHVIQAAANGMITARYALAAHMTQRVLNNYRVPLGSTRYRIC